MIIAPFPISVRSGYFIPVCSRNKFSNSRQIHPVGASKSFAISFFILDISVIIRVLLRVKSIGVLGVSIVFIHWFLFKVVSLTKINRITRVQYKFFCYHSFVNLQCTASFGSVIGISWAAVLRCVFLVYDFHGYLSSR